MTAPSVIITGASRGLGAAAARIAAGMGARVLLTARSAEVLQTVRGEIRAAGGEAVAFPGDISASETPQEVLAAALAAFGRLDAVINNAGVLEPLAPIAAFDLDGWTQHLRINLLGPVNLTACALPHLRETNGRVIQVSSGAAVSVYHGWGAYCTAKAGLNHFNRVLATEEPQVTAIALRPGAVDTAMQGVLRERGADSMQRADHQKFLDYHADGKLLPPEVPGRALAVLALYAPPSWSGAFLQWDEEKVQALVAAH